MIRRLTAIAAVGVVALGVLAGCRTEPGSAAYVGNTRITTDQVDEVVKGVPTSADLAVRRTEAVSELVYTTALQKYADANNITLAAIDPALRDQIAQTYQIPNDATHRPFIDLEAKRYTWTNDLLNRAPSTQPSDADLRRLFRELQADFNPGTTFEQAKPALLQVPNLAQGVALRKQLEPAFQSFDITISPMYANNCVKSPCPAPTVPLVNFQTQNGAIPVVNIALGSGQVSPPVVDLQAATSAAQS